MNSLGSASTANRSRLASIALVGNPNVGKTSLYNRLTNLLAKTSNFPGTTVELREATLSIGEQTVRLLDLPGLYTLDATSPEAQIARAYLAAELHQFAAPDGIVIIVDAMHLERTLFLVGQASALGLPTIVAVNMMDVAQKEGVGVDCRHLSERLGCPVVPISARTGQGIAELRGAIADLCWPASVSELPVLNGQPCDSCGGCAYANGYRWAATLARESTHNGKPASREFTDLADRLLTHKLLGAIVFAAVMLTVFASIFWVAQFPMTLLDNCFGMLVDVTSGWLPPGDVSDMINQGVIVGVGSVLVFLPQICILFFALAILEDCGYLSRAILVVDSWMRKAGLPGQAFVPLLAAHACAIPAIMSTRVIANRRDRLAAILVIPLMTCSARLPVYSMVAAMLFPDNALYAALLFAAAYFLGMAAAFVTAFLLRVTILPGSPESLILDLPPYRMPSVAHAVRHSLDRGWAFIRDAGTVILAISIAIWALSHYPKLDEVRFQQQLAQLSAADSSAEETNNSQIESQRSRLAQEHSILGRAGKLIEPVFCAIGFRLENQRQRTGFLRGT